MSYATISQSVNDGELSARINACAITEGTAPNEVSGNLYWAVCGASDVAQAYASALAAGNEHPGGDESVITDQMILSHVQAFVTANPTSP